MESSNEGTPIAVADTIINIYKIEPAILYFSNGDNFKVKTHLSTIEIFGKTILNQNDYTNININYKIETL